MLFHSPPGVLFTFPSQYYTLSVTEEYLALRGVSRSFHQGSTCLGVLWIPLLSFQISLTGLSPSLAGFPKTILLSVTNQLLWSLTPGCTHPGLGSFPFARRYSENRLFFLFLRLLRCFSSPGSPCMAMYSPCSDRGLLCRVSPFRHPRVNGHLHLSVAFRSLSRLSSALSAKASALRSY